MQVGICLLSKDGYYLREDGTLPVRPSWDKKFLVELTKNLTTICSLATYNTLPLSVKSTEPFILDYECDDYDSLPYQDINLGINTFKTLPELIFITRSNYNADGGKLLRLDKYSLLIDFEKEDGRFEIWKINSTN